MCIYIKAASWGLILSSMIGTLNLIDDACLIYSLIYHCFGNNLCIVSVLNTNLKMCALIDIHCVIQLRTKWFSLVISIKSNTMHVDMFKHKSCRLVQYQICLSISQISEI